MKSKRIWAGVLGATVALGLWFGIAALAPQTAQASQATTWYKQWEKKRTLVAKRRSMLKLMIRKLTQKGKVMVCWQPY